MSKPIDLPSHSHKILDRRQLDLDPLTLVFFPFAPVGEWECWHTDLKAQQQVAAKRAWLLVQLNGANFRSFRTTVSTCGDKRCINPWHAARTGPRKHPQPVPIQYPEIADRERLLLWYAAGNSPIRAVDVEDVKDIMATAPDLIRSYKGRTIFPS